MRDQADKLRMQMLQSQGKLGRSIAVVSGKGGVGKSNFSTNFATLLAQQGKRVVIVDMDIGMGNVHILLGKTVQYSLRDYLQGNMQIQDIMYEANHDLQYISGGSGMSSLMEWSGDMFTRLIQAFETLQQEFDYILFDMGAGATDWSLDLLTSIDEIIVISTAEPTSIMDAYSMMKFIHMKDEKKDYYLLCNRAFTPDEGVDTTERLKIAMQRFLQKDVHVLGALPEDPIVRRAVREQVPFSILDPHAPISKKLRQIVNEFIDEHEDTESNEVTNTSFLSKLKSIFAKGRA